MTFRFGNWAVVASAFTAVGLIALMSLSPSAVGLRSSHPGVRVTHVEVGVLSSVFYTGTLGVTGGDVVIGDTTSSAECRLAEVNPVSLQVLSNRNTPCTNPALDAQTVMPVESLAPKSSIGFVRIATLTGTSGVVHVGPVVMRYENNSESLPEWTYGGGYLWLYDTALSTGAPSMRRPPEVLRIDISTGEVSATIPFPSLPLAELAADSDGLWMARSQETPSSGTKPPALLYFLGTRSSSPKVVIQRGDYVLCLAAAGHTAWATLIGGNAELTDTFASPSSKPHTVKLRSNAIVPIELGQDPSDAQPVLVDANLGLFFITTGFRGSGTSQVVYEQVYKFNPSNGRETKFASIPVPKGHLQASIVYRGSLYLLIGSQSRYATLYRISP